MYQVVVLKEGYSRPENNGILRAGGTITLLKGSHIILVDTGSPWDRDLIIKGLQSHNLTPDDVQYVVCTHGHSDHVGNLNLFTQALHVVGFDICKKDRYILHDFKQGIPYEIDEDVEVLPTPGHTGNDVSVVVRRSSFGTVVVAGDLFECENDLESPHLWQDNSERPSLQQQNRIDVLRVADYIVPGHGPMFEVSKEAKKQLRVVMLTEELLLTSSDARTTMTTSSSECIIVEAN